MKKADYEKSLLSLMTSILKHYGVPTNRSSLPMLDELLAKDYKNVVVMLFDGLGDAILKKHLNQSDFLRANCKDVISSVFPPTTTAATTTMVTGLSPIEHCWLGWTLHFEEIQKNVCLFPNIVYIEDTPAADYNVANRYIPYESVFEKITKATNGNVQTYNISEFTKFETKTIKSICDTVVDLCKKDGKKYLYTYCKQPDYSMHEFGTTSDIVHSLILEINQNIQEMSEKLTDTLVVIVADHGLVDVEWEFLRKYPDVWNCLKDIPTVESRAMTFFVKDGMKKDFELAFNKHFGNIYELFTKEQVFEQKIFGDGNIHPHAHTFIGDYFAVALTNTSLTAYPKSDDVFKAAHAGTTADEYNVPFIVIDKK